MTDTPTNTGAVAGSDIIRELQHIRLGMLDVHQAAVILERLVSKAQTLPLAAAPTPPGEPLRHVDDMNDMVLMGLARDDAERRAEALQSDLDSARKREAGLREAFDYVCGLLPSAARAIEVERENYVLSCMVNVGELRKVRAFRAALSDHPVTEEGLGKPSADDPEIARGLLAGPTTPGSEEP